VSNAAHAAGAVVVLGASGLLGQALMRELACRGRTAVALSRRQGVDLAALPSVAALAEELDPLAPSLVINAAAITDLARCEERPQDAWLLHARLPGLLAHWSRSAGVPWVQVSTDHYFSGTANVLHDEDAPVAPPNEYARSKFAGEALALASPQALVLRTNIVGRRGWPGVPSFAEWVLGALQDGKPFAGYTDAWASSVEAGQCAAALLDLADAGHRGLLNVAASESISKADFITAMAQALCLDDGPMQRQHRPISRLPRANTLGLDVKRAQTLLGRPLPTTAEVAQALASQFKEHHHVPA